MKASTYMRAMEKARLAADNILFNIKVNTNLSDDEETRLFMLHNKRVRQFLDFNRRVWRFISFNDDEI